MNASLKRAIGNWAASQVEDLHAYADDLANAKHRYPAVVVTELTHDTKSMGCGKTEYVVRDTENGFVSRTGKMGVVETNYRLTVIAPSDNENNGQEIVDNILETLESAALMTWLSAGPLELIDPGCDPQEDFQLDSLKPIGRQSIPPDITGEPFLYRAALSVSVRRYKPIERPVENVIEHIHLNEETP